MIQQPEFYEEFEMVTSPTYITHTGQPVMHSPYSIQPNLSPINYYSPQDVSYQYVPAGSGYQQVYHTVAEDVPITMMQNSILPMRQAPQYQIETIAPQYHQIAAPPVQYQPQSPVYVKVRQPSIAATTLPPIVNTPRMVQTRVVQSVPAEQTVRITKSPPQALVRRSISVNTPRGSGAFLPVIRRPSNQVYF